MSIVERFLKIAEQPKFKGWSMVGDYEYGPKIPFFGQVMEYQLQTGKGVEDYRSIIRHFGWSMVFGVTTESMVPTLVQWKPGVNRASWEIPPGGIGKIAAGANRMEILETTKTAYLKETGYGGGNWSYIGYGLVETSKYRGAGPDDHGLPAHYWLATDLEKRQGARNPEPNEIMETLEVPLYEFRTVIESGLLEEISAQPCALLALIKLGKLKWA